MVIILTLKNSGFKKSLTSLIASSLLALSIILPVRPVAAQQDFQEPVPQHRVCQEHELCGRGVGFPNNPFYSRHLPREKMYQIIDAQMDAASQVADWIRIELITNDFYTGEYVFNWWDYAYLVESAHERDLDVVFLLDENMIEYETKDFSAPPDSDHTNPAIDDFLVAALLTGMLFDGNPFPAVDHYQIMNEPDDKNMDPDAIAEILNGSCSVLEGKHIIGPGLLTRTAVEYLERVYDSEAFGETCFDLAVHVYYGPKEVASDLDELLDFSQEHDQDLFVSEYGRPSDGSYNQEIQQLRYILKMEDIFDSKGILAHALYTLERSVFTGGFGIFSQEHGFNITGRVLTLIK